MPLPGKLKILSQPATSCAFLLLFNACSAGEEDRPNGFDLSDSVLPRKEIFGGGPARDGIPAIDNPKFLPSGEVDFLRDGDLVISMSVDGETRAYPLRILVWHEIVNDKIGEKAFAVTYCPLCGTSMVFDRNVGGRELDFGVSGLLYQSDVLMYDRQTESLWSQLALKGVSGEHANTSLKWLASEFMNWNRWKERYPEGKALSTETGYPRDYSRTPYDGYEKSDAIYFPVPKKRKELPNKTWVLGLIVNGQAKAYPLDRLPDNRALEDTLGGKSIELSYDAAARYTSAKDRETGKLLPGVQVYWFAWQAFYPETELFKGE